MGCLELYDYLKFQQKSIPMVSVADGSAFFLLLLAGLVLNLLYGQPTPGGDPGRSDSSYDACSSSTHGNHSPCATLLSDQT
jgi:hypothetical protein